jgi:WD40 repeat protein/predicted Ser/Thr protein kinase
MSSTGKCPQCGTQLFGDAAAGLCPRCLGALGLVGEPDDGHASRLHRLGDYELIEEIARGGMGVVYKARQVSLNRIVAVKVVLHGPFSSPQFAQRFRTEAAVVAGLQHPNIVAIHEVGQAGDDQFFSMEYIEGKNLADLVREKPLPAFRAAEYLKRIADAVQYAHEHGVLHRDLKPSNVLLDVFGEPRITDFGLAKLLDSDAELTTTGQVLGSPAYIAPEQAAGKLHEVAPVSDIYSLGAILYHLLTSRPPFQGETLPEILLQVQASEPVPPRSLNPSVPVDLQTICLKCLQKEPSRRYASARELSADLGRFLANEPIHARAVTPAERLWLWGKRRPVLAALILALHLVVLLGIVGVLWQWRRAEGQRHVAEGYAARVRLNLYAGDVSFAGTAVQRGSFGVARQTLSALRPEPGDVDLRGFEWRYLWDQCRGDQIAVLGEHADTVTCATFSPDGKLLATGSRDSSVKIWNVAQRKLITTLNATTGEVWSVTFTPDAKLLMTSGLGGTKFWDVNSWQVTKTFPGCSASMAQTVPLLAVADTHLIYWWQPPGLVSIWNYVTGEKVRDITKSGRTIALSPDGTIVATGERPRGVHLWDVASGEFIRTLTTSNAPWSLNFSADSKHLLGLAGNRNLFYWNLTSDTPGRRVDAHPAAMWAAVFSPEDSTFATVSSDQSLRLTDVATLETTQIFRGHEHEVWCVAFSPDGKLLASGGKDCKVMLWNREPRERISTLPSRRIWRPFFSTAGDQIVTIAPEGTESTLWQLDGKSRPQSIPGRWAIGFAPDGKHLVSWTDGGKALEFVERDSTNAAVVALESGNERRKTSQFHGFTPDWKVIFADDTSGRVGFWDTETGRLRRSIKCPLLPLSSGALSPDARYFALGAQQENAVRLYDLQSGEENILTGHRGAARGLAFSPDGKLLASGSLDGTIKLWDVATRQCSATLPGHMEETSDVAFSPDGRTLASVNERHSVKLWHVATRREVVSLEMPGAGAWLRFSPDGKYLAVTTQTNSVQLFEAPPLEDKPNTPLKVVRK